MLRFRGNVPRDSTTCRQRLRHLNVCHVRSDNYEISHRVLKQHRLAMQVKSIPPNAKHTMTNTAVKNPIIKTARMGYIGRSWSTERPSMIADETLSLKSGAASSSGSIVPSPKSKIRADRTVSRPASGMTNLATTERLLVPDGMGKECRQYAVKTASDVPRKNVRYRDFVRGYDYSHRQ